jgi:hypothetical protein
MLRAHLCGDVSYRATFCTIAQSFFSSRRKNMFINVLILKIFSRKNGLKIGDSDSNYVLDAKNESQHWFLKNDENSDHYIDPKPGRTVSGKKSKF